MSKLNAFAAFVCVLAAAGLASASSHREAPAIAEDQYADNTDTYGFVSSEDANRVVLIANYVPLLSPASGPNFYRFSDSVLYAIRIDNDGDAVADIAYEFRFRNEALRDPNTFLYNFGAVETIDDADLNVRQTYTITRRDLDTGAGTMIGTGIPAAPWDVGPRSFPNYDTVAGQAVRTNGTVRSFAGPRGEAFAVDFNTFDLLGIGPNAVSLPHYASVYNVMTIAIDVPITDIAQGGTRPTRADAMNSQIGLYATASRPQVTFLRQRQHTTGRLSENRGQWVQVSRLGIPLVNEVLIPLGQKDLFNRSSPAGDVAAFGGAILNPLLNTYLRVLIPALGCMETQAGGNPTLLAVLTVNGVTPGDLLRVPIHNTATFATSHFPNGRRLEDDVTTAEVNIICSANPAAPDPGAPLPANAVTGPVPDGITTTFPYMPSPIRP